MVLRLMVLVLAPLLQVMAVDKVQLSLLAVKMVLPLGLLLQLRPSQLEMGSVLLEQVHQP